MESFARGTKSGFGYGRRALGSCLVLLVPQYAFGKARYPPFELSEIGATPKSDGDRFN